MIAEEGFMLTHLFPFPTGHPGALQRSTSSQRAILVNVQICTGKPGGKNQMRTEEEWEI